MPLTIEIEQEDDGRWLAEIADIPGVIAYGQTRAEAFEQVLELYARTKEDREKAAWANLGRKAADRWESENPF